jgi:membrane protein YqaA with SNARE-associated domain
VTATDDTSPPAQQGAPTFAPEPQKRRGMLRRLYDWVLHWSETPHATPALFGLSLAESSFFPIPPDVLLAPLCLGDRAKAFRFAFWCSLASVLGGILGYLIGAFLWEGTGMSQLFFDYVPGFTQAKFDQVQRLYEDWNFWIVFAAAFTPIPFKVITITAGVFGINFPMFLVASAIGRSARFYLIASLLYWFGAPVQRFLDKHLGWVTLALVALGVAGFVVLKYAV